MDASVNFASGAPHPELQKLRLQLREIHDAMANFGPVTVKPPILDSSFDLNGAPEIHERCLQQESVPGLRALRDTVGRDLGVLEKFLADERCALLPPLSTNAPYLIAVWDEVLLAPPPIVSVCQTFHETSEPAMLPKRGSRRPSGVKVDVVADSGRRWIRVNTIKNSRMLAELREIDSYLTDSEDDTDERSDDWRPSLAQNEFDNSILRMGRALLAAAKRNPIPGTSEPPVVTLRLTRLDPSPTNVKEHDSRIAQTIKALQDMSIDVQLGERDSASLPIACPSRSTRLHCLEPTVHINLDLSILIALVSDITHAPLPLSIEEAELRFVPPPQYREWKKKRIEAAKGEEVAAGLESLDFEEGAGKHSRALSNQALQEMRKGLLQEIRDRLTALARLSPERGFESDNTSRFTNVEFWTTPEARDRCLRIVLSKIGGPNEKRRAQALFFESVTAPMSLENAEEAYWRDSRYPHGFLPLLRIRIFPSSEPDADCEPPSHSQGTGGGRDDKPLSPFFRQLAYTCRAILARGAISESSEPIPRSLEGSESAAGQVAEGQGVCKQVQEGDSDNIPRASVTRASPRLTVHTVQSMLWGAVRGWTTLTANKTSVKAILREMKATGATNAYERSTAGSFQIGKARELEDDEWTEKAALWVVDPRSLAESMRSDLKNNI
ncbi:hypothetical protein AcW1_002848 [Taiwanofungus camphoratus]|nr:hypothetical protein AcW1_002848 [Antrodia cinnamomea]